MAGLERLGLGSRGGLGGRLRDGVGDGRGEIEATEFWISGLFSVIIWLPFNVAAGLSSGLGRWPVGARLVVLAAEWSDGGRMGISRPEFTGWGCERWGRVGWE